MFNKIEKRVLNRISSLKKIRRVRHKPTGKIIKSFSALDEKNCFW